MVENLFGLGWTCEVYIGHWERGKLIGEFRTVNQKLYIRKQRRTGNQQRICYWLEKYQSFSFTKRQGGKGKNLNTVLYKRTIVTGMCFNVFAEEDVEYNKN